MRIASLEISGFRAFSSEQEFDLDADTVLIVGPNGQGKTSLFDAILWSLTGQVPRLGTAESIVSLFSETGEARVAVGLRSEEGRSLTVVRRFDGKATQLLLEADDHSYRGPQAENELLQRLWQDALTAGEPQEAFCAALERGVYLQQDLLTSFLSADSDQERFAAISELVGAGRVTELQASLERSRSAWSRATNTRSAEADELVQRMARLDSQLEGMATVDTGTPVDEAAWRAWWEQASGIGLDGIDIPDIESSDAAGALDAAVKQLQAIQLSDERRREAGATLIAELGAAPVKPTDDLDALRKAAGLAQTELGNARDGLAVAEEKLAQLRRSQVEMREQRQQLRLLAELALGHLGEHCPVCDQTYDRESTRQRLKAMLKDEPEARPTATDIPDITALANSVQEHEQSASGTVRQLAEAETAQRDWSAWQRRLTDRLNELGIKAEDMVDSPVRMRLVAEEREGELGARIAALSEIRQRGEALAVELARAGQLARRAELERERAALTPGLDSIRGEVLSRQRTGELVTIVIEALREAGSDLVEEQLRRLEPLLQRIYATADPHPAFRVVKLLSRMRRGRGHVSPEIEDPVYDLHSDSPGAILSSSQMNVLAVSVFLALNLGMPALPLETAILDDPLQSLDDLNLLGLVDLLRRMRERRQLMISTHDARFGALLERKLRPVSDTQRTVVVEMQGWSREGPALVTRDIARDELPLRIAA